MKAAVATLSHYPNIRLDELRKYMKSLCQDSRPKPKIQSGYEEGVIINTL
jgi:hypothetical protein